MGANKTEEGTEIHITLPRNSALLLDGSGMDEQEFYAFCRKNADLRIEKDQHGKIIIMPPTSSETGRRNSEIHLEIGIWNRQHKLGITFDSSTGFKLPSGAERSPDTAWILKERWDALPDEDKQKFAPDFVLELRSTDQNLAELREKMDEYLSGGCRLGWLIDPQNRRTYVYAENGDIHTVSFDAVLSGGTVLPGLEIKLAEVLD